MKVTLVTISVLAVAVSSLPYYGSTCDPKTVTVTVTAQPTPDYASVDVYTHTILDATDSYPTTSTTCTRGRSARSNPPTTGTDSPHTGVPTPTDVYPPPGGSPQSGDSPQTETGVPIPTGGYPTAGDSSQTGASSETGVPTPTDVYPPPGGSPQSGDSPQTETGVPIPTSVYPPAGEPSQTGVSTPRGSPTTGSSPPGGKTHFVKVGGKDGSGTPILKYEPSVVYAEIGDTIVYDFLFRNHTVTEGTLNHPCKPKKHGTINSGFKLNLANIPGTQKYEYTVIDKKSHWLYCAQAQHCQAGMVMAINPPKESSIFENFVERAKKSPIYSQSSASLPLPTTTGTATATATDGYPSPTVSSPGDGYSYGDSTSSASSPTQAIETPSSGNGGYY